MPILNHFPNPRIQAPLRYSSLPPLHAFPVSGPRILYVMRHGERSDFCFGPEWVNRSFSEDGKYQQANLNLQTTVPLRENSPSSFHHIFVSPALRCVMTATKVLKALNIAHRMPLKIEPGLFEWLAWYSDGVPQFMNAEELTVAGYCRVMNYLKHYSVVINKLIIIICDVARYIS
jgi:ubiquitin-associated SH3 domain-containing protein